MEQYFGRFAMDQKLFPCPKNVYDVSFKLLKQVNLNLNFAQNKVSSLNILFLCAKFVFVFFIESILICSDVGSLMGFLFFAFVIQLTN